jgi:hypothetical protein
MLARMREIALRASNALALQCVSWWLGFGTMRGARSDSMVAAGFATCKQSGARLLHPSDRGRRASPWDSMLVAASYRCVGGGRDYLQRVAAMLCC